MDIKSFNNACDEFLAGKYILAEVKITCILREIANNEKLKNIVSNALENYEFKTEFSKHIGGDEEHPTLTLPKSEKEIISFVYSLLYTFDKKQISLYDFLRKFYGNDDNHGQEVYSFATNILLPFKNAVNNIYSKTHVIVTTDEYQENHYNHIKETVREILNNADDYKLKMTEKEEFTLLLNSLYLASDKNDKRLVYSLMIGLDYFTRNYKKCRPAFLSLENCFNNK